MSSHKHLVDQIKEDLLEVVKILQKGG